LRVSAGARAAVMRRCRGACEACGLEWPWLLYLFRIDQASPPRAANLRALCGPCSANEVADCAPLLTRPSLRDRVREANNRRAGTTKLTAARRRRLIAARGGSCEICGVSGLERQLDVQASFEAAMIRRTTCLCCASRAIITCSLARRAAAGGPRSRRDYAGDARFAAASKSSTQACPGSRSRRDIHRSSGAGRRATNLARYRKDEGAR
jgi:hypothetical protein